MSVTPCTPCCATTQTVNTPGTAGAAAFTLTSASFVIPAADANVTVTVLDTSWMSDGLNLWIGGANFEINVGGVLGPTTVSVKFLNFDGDTATGSTIASGTKVTAGTGGLDFPLSIANGGTGQATRLAAITALIDSADISGVNNFTDSSTGTAGDAIAAGVGVHTLAFAIQLAAMTTAAADLMTNYTPGFRFKVLSVSFVTTTIGAGAGASQTLNLEIGTTNLTGGVVVVTLAGTDTLGELTAGSAVTANNVGTAADTLSVEVAAAGTVFTAGAGILLVRIQNMDTADAFASIASKSNSIYNSLKT